MVLVGPSGLRQDARRCACSPASSERHDGRILIGDRVVNNVAPRHRDIAMVFQSYALYPHMTVYDNLAFGLRNQKVPQEGDRRRVRRRGARSSTSIRLIKRKPKQLSGRPAPARRARPRDRARARGVPDGRAALEPRRAAPRADARGDPQAAAAARHDHDLRHARPGRGDDDGRPDRGHETAACCSRSARPRSSTRARRTCSSRASSARPR